jgi:hypothetical protein
MRYIQVLFLLLLFSCNLDKGKHVDKAKLTFKTGSDTQLFFKNVRQSYYDIEENRAAGLNVFRFSDRLLTDQKPIINLAIVVNYLQDEAYVLLEPNEMIGYDGILIRATDEKNNISYNYQLSDMSKVEMLNFAAIIYDGILAGYVFKIELNGEFIPLLNDHKEREAFRITVSDFYRLTRVL